MPPIPSGTKNKAVKDGAALTYENGTAFGDTDFIYALKGNNRYEFYRYNTTSNAWTTMESIPAIGTSGKKKAVKKGSALAAANGLVYAAKGGNTSEWWAYTPTANTWRQMTDVPLVLKQGAGAAGVTIGDTAYVYMLMGSNTASFYRYNTMRPRPARGR